MSTKQRAVNCHLKMCGHRVVLAVLLWITGTLNGCFGNEEELLFTTVDRCGEAPLIDNGDIVEYSRVHFKYLCRPGYTLHGEDTVLCYSNSSWSELPRCKEEELLLTTIDRCGEAPLIDNGDIVQRSRVHLKYQCRPGYTLHGEDTVLCYSNSSWSELPRCEGEKLLLTTIDRCGEAPLIDNGDIVKHSRVHLKYQCRPGYALRGQDTVLCYSNSSWSELPRCIEDTACFDPKIANANYTKFHYVRNNERIWIRCNRGYEDKNRRVIALCLNGQWTALPVCEKMASWCGPPPQIPNTVIINQVHEDVFPEDTYVEYECKSGFELETNSNQAVCSYGQWLTPPSCRQTQTNQGRVPLATTVSPTSSGSDDNSQLIFTTIDKCGTPPSVMKGNFFPHENNISVTYKCSFLYKLKGSPIVRCANGRWTPPPTCEVDFCRLNTSRYSDLKNVGVVFIKNGAPEELSCVFSPWRTAHAVCNNNELSLSECCFRPTQNVNTCGYFPVTDSP